MSKVNFSLRKLQGEPNTTSNSREPVQRASEPGITPLKGSIALADSCRVYPHFADCVLIYQIKSTAVVHKDSSEMVSVNYWV